MNCTLEYSENLAVWTTPRRMMLDKGGQSKVSKKVGIIPEYSRISSHLFWEWVADCVRQESKMREVFAVHLCYTDAADIAD